MKGERRVYFMRAAEGFGPVKIGCSRIPEARMNRCLPYAPYPLEIVASLPGDFRLERRFHALFASTHSHSEWFHPSPLLERTILAIQAGEFDETLLPAWETARRIWSWKSRTPTLEAAA